LNGLIFALWSDARDPTLYDFLTLGGSYTGLMALFQIGLFLSTTGFGDRHPEGVSLSMIPFVFFGGIGMILVTILVVDLLLVIFGVMCMILTIYAYREAFSYLGSQANSLNKEMAK
jgi:hypothetical protein